MTKLIFAAILVQPAIMQYRYSIFVMVREIDNFTKKTIKNYNKLGYFPWNRALKIIWRHILPPFCIWPLADSAHTFESEGFRQLIWISIFFSEAETNFELSSRGICHRIPFFTPLTISLGVTQPGSQWCPRIMGEIITFAGFQLSLAIVANWR